MMTKQTAAAIETIRCQLRTLRAVAANMADWQDADAINATADVIAEQLEALELDAQPACDELPAGVHVPTAGGAGMPQQTGREIGAQERAIMLVPERDLGGGKGIAA